VAIGAPATASQSGTGINNGTIVGTGNSGEGVDLSTGGAYVANNVGASILGAARGVVGTAADRAVSSYCGGEGAGTGRTRVLLTSGLVINRPGGLISGIYDGVSIASSGTVVNDGTAMAEAAGGFGVRVSAGSVVNTGTVVAGADGIGIYLNSGNVTNYGTVIA